jgi:hypothetical protein
MYKFIQIMRDADSMHKLNNYPSLTRTAGSLASSSISVKTRRVRTRHTVSVVVHSKVSIVMNVPHLGDDDGLHVRGHVTAKPVRVR